MIGNYKIVTLCGSTRFKDTFLKVQKELTLKGYIVLTVGLFGHSGDNEVWDNLDEGETSKTKQMLDDMHKRKIDLSDEIYVINVNRYIGESTKSEIEYAIKHNKKVNYLEKDLSLYVPNLEDYWYQKQLQEDPKTMDYNIGYDIDNDRYHFDTGCIDFPKSNWERIYNLRKNENKYLAYIKDNDLNQFVGYVNYQYNKDEKRYECGVVIENKYRNQGYGKKSLELLLEAAKANDVKELYDSFEKDRLAAVKLFKELGFEVFKETTWKKNHQDVKGLIVRKVL